jgi:hypothetical protein
LLDEDQLPFRVQATGLCSSPVHDLPPFRASQFPHQTDDLLAMRMIANENQT